MAEFTERVTSVECEMTFHLSNNISFMVKLDKLGATNDLVNYLRSLVITEELAAGTTNPVGVICANTVKLEIKSLNKYLIPTFEGSPYFGYMDDTAYITVVIKESNDEIAFGTYYINKWIGNLSSADPYKVTIEAYDIMSTISKSEVPDVDIIGDTNIKEYLVDIINAWNENSEDKYHINYNDSDIVFDEFETMQFSGLNTESMSKCFNALGQSTLTNIYVDRSNYIKTDYTCDDTAGESVVTLTDSLSTSSILKASVVDGNLVGYKGITVKYSNGTIGDIEPLTTVSNEAIINGVNTLSNINLGDNVYKVNYISILTDKFVYAYVSSEKYNKNKATINITSEGVASCKVSVHGQRMSDATLSLSKYTNSNKGTMLTITNRILTADKIETYADKMIALMEIKKNTLEISGYFNPRIKLGDTVKVEATKGIEVSGYYKVVRLEWTVGSTLKCNMKLTKVILE